MSSNASKSAFNSMSSLAAQMIDGKCIGNSDDRKGRGNEKMISSTMSQPGNENIISSARAIPVTSAALERPERRLAGYQISGQCSSVSQTSLTRTRILSPINRMLILTLFLFIFCVNVSSAKNPIYGNSSTTSSHSVDCKDGLIIPVWMPKDNLSTGDIMARGLVYFLALVYLFIGVSIIADRFMAAIEVITSQEKDVEIKKPDGQVQVISVRIWNETVSNLTLMALGSSAPEILLSIIEIYAQDYEAGELGPGTIVGSAAFNMFVIIAICVYCIPTPEVKKIKHLRVFFVTMVWSVFAYIWLYAIICWISYGVVEVWEGLLTFAFFPATVGTAYIADRRLLIYKYLNKKYRMNKRGVIVGGEGGEDVEMGDKAVNHINDGFKVFEEEANDEMKEFEEHRRQFIQLLKTLRQKHPDATMEALEMMAREELLNQGPKSRAFYRLQATKKLTGGTSMGRKRLDKMEEKKEEVDGKKDDNVIRISFDPAHYTVMENVGEFAVNISREGDLTSTACVDFKTEDGTANAGSDFEGVEETITFAPGETQKQVFITVIDDDVFEEDEHFYCRLSNPHIIHTDKHSMNGGAGAKQRPTIELSTPCIATVMILDDDHGGIFSFPESVCEVSEAVGCLMLKVSRSSGARGRVLLPYKTSEGSAKAGKEFDMTEGELDFGNNESWKEIPIAILDNESYEKDAVFYVELGEPKREEDICDEGLPGTPNSEHDDGVALLGRPRLGDITKCNIRVKESKEFKNTVDKLFQKANTSLLIGTSSWKEQFIEAITVSAGDDDGDGGEGDEEGDGEQDEKMPSCSDYVMHFLTLFWKILFAFVPPTDIWGGWACFVTSIVAIGALTAVVGDVASHFGCTVFLKDSVTAISCVALGTSVPDTFASKVAAQNDRYADSSIGNVTGSNAVNVFLGIGIAWTIAALVHWKRGTPFVVKPGNLAFSVTLFCICAFICCFALLVRRRLFGGELGGQMKSKVITATLFVGLWIFYVFMSSLEAYEIFTF